MKRILATENTPRRTVRDALSVIKTEPIAFMKSKELRDLRRSIGM
jgi:hypothetical protein